MSPLVLIKSFGKEKSGDIINELLRINDEIIIDPMSICINSCHLKAHTLSICTKYYKTHVLLFECDDIYAIPNEVIKEIEGAILYFDCDDFNFLSEVEAVVDFVKNSNIGVSTLITRNLCENGLYDNVRSKCNLDLNVIDLNGQTDNEEPIGYAEVLELLKNNVWSNIPISAQNSHKINDSEENDANAEDILSEFEELLNKFQQFKDVSRNMCREEILQNAENLAELFEKMLNED